MGVLYLLSMTQDHSFTSLDGHSFCMAEYLFATGQREFFDQFYLLRLLGVIL